LPDGHTADLSRGFQGQQGCHGFRRERWRKLEAGAFTKNGKVYEFRANVFLIIKLLRV
jgi:hypothetical protein